MSFLRKSAVFLALLFTVSVIATPAGADDSSSTSGTTEETRESGSQSLQFERAPASAATAPVAGVRYVRWPWSSGCRHTGASDDIHLTNRGTEVSVHGWWVALNDNCPAKADVWVELQAWRCETKWFGRICNWYRLDKSKPKRVFSGGGSANRVNARHGCQSSQWVTFRAVVDVDIPGEVDSADRWSWSYDLPCDPAT